MAGTPHPPVFKLRVLADQPPQPFAPSPNCLHSVCSENQDSCPVCLNARKGACAPLGGWAMNADPQFGKGTPRLRLQRGLGVPPEGSDPPRPSAKGGALSPSSFSRVAALDPKPPPRIARLRAAPARPLPAGGSGSSSHSRLGAHARKLLLGPAGQHLGAARRGSEWGKHVSGESGAGGGAAFGVLDYKKSCFACKLAGEDVRASARLEGESRGP